MAINLFQQQASSNPFPPSCPVYVCDDENDPLIIKNCGVVKGISIVETGGGGYKSLYNITFQQKSVENGEYEYREEMVEFSKLRYPHGCRVYLKEYDKEAVVLGFCYKPRSSEFGYWLNLNQTDRDEEKLEMVSPSQIRFKSEDRSQERIENLKETANEAKQPCVGTVPSCISLLPDEKDDVSVTSAASPTTTTTAPTMDTQQQQKNLVSPSNSYVARGKLSNSNQSGHITVEANLYKKSSTQNNTENKNNQLKPPEKGKLTNLDTDKNNRHENLSDVQENLPSKEIGRIPNIKCLQVDQDHTVASTKKTATSSNALLQTSRSSDQNERSEQILGKRSNTELSRVSNGRQPSHHRKMLKYYQSKRFEPCETVLTVPMQPQKLKDVLYGPKNETKKYIENGSDCIFSIYSPKYMNHNSQLSVIGADRSCVSQGIDFIKNALRSADVKELTMAQIDCLHRKDLYLWCTYCRRGTHNTDKCFKKGNRN